MLAATATATTDKKVALTMTSEGSIAHLVGNSEAKSRMMRRHGLEEEHALARQAPAAGGDAAGGDAAGGDAAGGEAAPAAGADAAGGAAAAGGGNATAAAKPEAKAKAGGGNATVAKAAKAVSEYAWHDCHLSGNTKLKCGGNQMSCGCKRDINDHYEDTCCHHDPIKSRPESPVCHATCRPAGVPALAGQKVHVPEINAGAGAPPGTPRAKPGDKEAPKAGKAASKAGNATSDAGAAPAKGGNATGVF